jgi:hypothetical protein
VRVEIRGGKWNICIKASGIDGKPMSNGNDGGYKAAGLLREAANLCPSCVLCEGLGRINGIGVLEDIRGENVKPECPMNGNRYELDEARLG